MGRHVITLLTMVQSDAFEEEVEEAEERLHQWIENEDLAPFVRCRAVATEARLEAIVTEAEQHDLIVMAASQTSGLRRLFIGSLAEAHIFPAINISASGTRKEERLYGEEETRCITNMRRMLAGMKPAEAMESLLKFMEKYPTNEELLVNLPVDI